MLIAPTFLITELDGFAHVRGNFLRVVGISIGAAEFFRAGDNHVAMGET